jgi:hypothetical protein
MKKIIKRIFEFPAKMLEFMVELPGTILKLWKHLMK